MKKIISIIIAALFCIFVIFMWEPTGLLMLSVMTVLYLTVLNVSLFALARWYPTLEATPAQTKRATVGLTVVLVGLMGWALVFATKPPG
ncbi:MAG: hypothetical protein Q7U16_10320 [Agitococcus sp.]|nr:hypothetical protein [Agitococcus sp.]